MYITFLALIFLMAFLAFIFLSDWPGKGEVSGNLNEIVHKKGNYFHKGLIQSNKGEHRKLNIQLYRQHFFFSIQMVRLPFSYLEKRKDGYSNTR